MAQQKLTDSINLQITQNKKQKRNETNLGAKSKMEKSAGEVNQAHNMHTGVDITFYYTLAAADPNV